MDDDSLEVLIGAACEIIRVCEEEEFELVETVSLNYSSLLARKALTRDRNFVDRVNLGFSEEVLLNYPEPAFKANFRMSKLAFSVCVQTL